MTLLLENTLPHTFPLLNKHILHRHTLLNKHILHRHTLREIQTLLLEANSVHIATLT